MAATTSALQVHAIATRIIQASASMDWNDFLNRHHDLLEKNSRYERLFVDTVLRRVDGLGASSVEVQKPFVDDDGGNRRIDFAIVEGDHLRIAIEVDGYDKTGRGSGMDRREFADFLHRESSLTRQGWRVLRFANVRVRDHPDRCARQVELTLIRERALLDELDHARQRMSELEEASARMRTVANLTQPERRELERLERENQESIARLTKEVDAARRAATHQKQENQWMVRVALAMAAVAIAAIFAVANANGRPQDPPPIDVAQPSHPESPAAGGQVTYTEPGNPQASANGPQVEVVSLPQSTPRQVNEPHKVTPAPEPGNTHPVDPDVLEPSGPTAPRELSYPHVTAWDAAAVAGDTATVCGLVVEVAFRRADGSPLSSTSRNGILVSRLQVSSGDVTGMPFQELSRACTSNGTYV